MSRYPLLEYMGFDNDISDGVEKMRAAIPLVEIVRLHQHTKNPLKYVHTNSNYGHLSSMPSSDTQYLYLAALENNSWVSESGIAKICPYFDFVCTYFSEF